MQRAERGTVVGRVAEIRRYPVKSMQGESLNRVRVGPAGLDGDRRYAAIDAETGRVASAKNPRRWATLLGLCAELREGILVVTAPGGSEYPIDRGDFHAEVSRLVGRAVTIRGTPTSTDEIEIEWPDIPGLANAGSDSIYELPVGGYFDLAPVHVLTTASLRRLAESTPGADFDPRRFRPNLIVETLPALEGFVDQQWVGRTLVLGEIRLRITGPCSRCVMTTLAQPGLESNPRILRAAVEHNGASVGVYASAEQYGDLATGDPFWLE